MESAISGAIVITLLVLMVFTISHTFLSVQDMSRQSWLAFQARAEQRVRTELEPIGAQTVSAGSQVEITLRNSGQARLADFDRWDVILEYGASTSDHLVESIPYQDFSANRWWQVDAIYQDASLSQPEAFEPNILNPAEEIVLEIWLDPTVGLATTNRATIVTANGIVASIIFTR